MDILEWLQSSVAGIPDALLWALAAAFGFLENGVGLGFVVPGETAIVVLATAVDSPASAAVMWAVVLVAGSLGDHVGYLLGRRYGPRLRDRRVIRRLGVQRWDDAVQTVRRRGALGVFLTRLVPVIRTLTPPAAGVAGVTWPRFLAASLSGAALWSGLYVVGGYLLRSSFAALQATIGNVVWVVLGGLAVAVVAVVLVRRAGVRRSAVSSAPRGPVGALLPAVRVVAAALLPVIAPWSLPVAAAVAAGAVVLGEIDRRRARGRVRSSRAGRVLAAASDQVVIAAMAIALVVAQLLPWELMALVLIPDLLLAASALVLFRGDPGLPASALARLRTGILSVALLAVSIGGIGQDAGGDEGAAWVIRGGMVLLLAGVLLHGIVAIRQGQDLGRRALASPLA